MPSSTVRTAGRTHNTPARSIRRGSRKAAISKGSTARMRAIQGGDTPTPKRTRLPTLRPMDAGPRPFASPELALWTAVIEQACIDAGRGLRILARGIDASDKIHRPRLIDARDAAAFLTRRSEARALILDALDLEAGWLESRLERRFGWDNLERLAALPVRYQRWSHTRDPDPDEAPEAAPGPGPAPAPAPGPGPGPGSGPAPAGPQTTPRSSPAPRAVGFLVRGGVTLAALVA